MSNCTTVNRNKTFDRGTGAAHRPSTRTPHRWKPSPRPGASGEFLVGPELTEQGTETDTPQHGDDDGSGLGEFSSGERPSANFYFAQGQADGETNRVAITQAADFRGSMPTQPDDSQPSSWERVESRDLGMAWDFVMEHERVPVEIQLRALVQGLEALELLHEGALGNHPARPHGGLWQRKLWFHADGTAFYAIDDESHDQPARYMAPELSHGHPPDRASDVFAMGVMVLEALLGIELTPRNIWGVYLEDVHAHAFWARHAHDPLVFVALRAIAVRPQARWASAGAFARGLLSAGAQRIQSVAGLEEFLRQSIRHSEDRATPIMGVREDSESEPPLLDDAELISLLPYEPGSWRISRGAETEVQPEAIERAVCPTLVDLPGPVGVLDWSDFRESEPKPVSIEPTARHSNTLISPPPAAPRSRWWRRLLLVGVVLGGGAAVLLALGGEQVENILQSLYGEVSGTPSAATVNQPNESTLVVPAAPSARVGRTVPAETSRPSDRVEIAEPLPGSDEAPRGADVAEEPDAEQSAELPTPSKPRAKKRSKVSTKNPPPPDEDLEQSIFGKRL